MSSRDGAAMARAALLVLLVACTAPNGAQDAGPRTPRLASPRDAVRGAEPRLVAGLGGALSAEMVAALLGDGERAFRAKVADRSEGEPAAFTYFEEGRERPWSSGRGYAAPYRRETLRLRELLQPADRESRYVTRVEGASEALDAIGERLGVPRDGLSRNLWIGSGAYVATPHYDMQHNFLVQVHGSKTVYLWPPSAQREGGACRGDGAPAVQRGAAFLPHPWPHPSWRQAQRRQQQHQQQQDGADGTERAVSQFAGESCGGGGGGGGGGGALSGAAFVATLSAGDVLYIPATWWHAVSADGASASVNFWWDSPHFRSFQRAERMRLPFRLGAEGAHADALALVSHAADAICAARADAPAAFSAGGAPPAAQTCGEGLLRRLLQRSLGAAAAAGEEAGCAEPAPGERQCAEAAARGGGGDEELRAAAERLAQLLADRGVEADAAALLLADYAEMLLDSILGAASSACVFARYIRDSLEVCAAAAA